MKDKIFTLFTLSRKRTIIFRTCLIGFMVLSCFATSLRAAGLGDDKALPAEDPQQVTVRGTVTDATTREPMPGVNILVTGTTIGTMTGANGEYSLQVPGTNVTLQFSFIGYVAQEIPLQGRTTVNVSLLSDIEQLSEVVVVGYGTVKKSDLTGSVTGMQADRIVDKPVVNIGQALTSKISGVHVVNQGGGIPGGNPMIRIRGTNSISTSGDPLFVVDGVVGVSNALTNLNPEDISSIDVLKDASSTAIYGARGANGVIIITTKRGTSGKIQVDYRGYTTLSVMNRHTYAMNAEQLMYTYLQSMANGDKFGSPNRTKDFRPEYAKNLTFSELPHLFIKSDGNYPVKLLGKDGNYYEPRYDTNWENYAYGSTWSDNHYLDVRGGSDAAKFSLAIGYSNQNGVMIDSYYKRYNAKVTGDIVIAKWLDISTNLMYIQSKQSNDNGITRSASEVWPIVPVQYPNDPETFGIYALRWGTNADFNVGEQWYNIVFRRDQEFGYTLRNQTIGSVLLNAKITEHLSFKTDFSIDFDNAKTNYFAGYYYGTRNTANIRNNNGFYWQNQDYFNYDRIFGSHTINAVLGLSWSRDNYEQLYAQNRYFFTDAYIWHNLGAGNDPSKSMTSGDGQSSLNSYFGRLNYSYKGKYLLTATTRIDGSSKFGANSKYGIFPSFGVAWRVSQEDFMSNVASVSDLKLRGSWGKTGNQEIGRYVTQRYIGNTTVTMGTGELTGIYPSSEGNPDLKWETTAQWDIGLDLGLFGNRVLFVADYYQKETTDMLLSVPLPVATTVGSVTMNYGSVGNKGIELQLTTRNIVGQDFSWRTDITATSNKNTVLGLGPTGADIYGELGAGKVSFVTRVGEPIGSFFGLTRLGTWSTTEAAEAARYGMLPGDLKFFDKNNDGKIDFQADGDIIGRAWPKLIAGINNTFTYKGFDAQIDIQIIYGVDKGFIKESAEDRQLVSGGLNSSLQAWRPDAQNSMVAQFRPGNGGCYYQSYADQWQLTDASYIRGNTGTIGYTFPDNTLGLQMLRIYVNASNFFLLTKAEGYDPEGSSIDKTYSLAPNQDKYQYPNPTKLSFGINVNF